MGKGWRAGLGVGQRCSSFHAALSPLACCVVECQFVLTIHRPCRAVLPQVEPLGIILTQLSAGGGAKKVRQRRWGLWAVSLVCTVWPRTHPCYLLHALASFMA